MTYPQLAVRRAVAAIESGTSVNAMDFPSAEDEAGVLKTSCVSKGYFDATENKVVDPDELHRVSCPVRSDRLIVSRMNTPALVGAAGHTQRDYDNLYLPDRLWQVRTSEAAVARYIYWWMQTREYRDQVAAICVGTSSSMQNLSQNDFLSFQMPLPNQETQNSISEFLDRESAQIDQLIGKQERLIELLAEKRQAIITQAVTKGLDPTAPTKPSGIPWLGEINASWPVRPLKAAGQISLGKMIQPSPKTETDFEAPYLRAANVQPNGVLALDDVKKMWFNESELRSLDVSSGDVVVVEGGVGGFGRAAYVEKDLPGFGYQNSINRIRPSESVDGRYLTYLLLTARHAGFIHAYCTGVSMPHLTAEKLAAISVPLPARSTQTQISDRLDAQISKLNALSDKASAVIANLAERRSALISAAVTGKLAKFS